jgi:molecular chaperone DnaK (HSP70)
MPGGLPRIEVTFLIDANGILSVRAKELRSGTEASVEVKPTYGLSEADVERMIDESLEHAEADVRARGVIDARNEADTVLRATEKALVQGAGFLDADEAGRIREAVAALATARQGDDAGAIREATDRVNRETQQLAERLMDTALRETLRERRVADLPAGDR